MVNEKQLTVFVLLITFLAPAFTSEGCKISFGNRGCYSKVLKGVIVTCDGGGSHTTIPKDIPEDTIYLSLTNFSIKGLSRNDFTHLRLVECLIITNSGLSAIEPDAFTEMRKLLELEIQSSHLRDKDLEFLNYPEFTAQYVGISGSNNIRHLSANGTNFLHKIKSLKLRNNGLGYVNPSFLRQLINVEVLDFSNNVLEFLDMSPLSGHRKLNHLYLFGNRFQTLSESALDTFETVKDLEFGRNPLHCNCHLKWLKEYYERTVDRTLDYDVVECVSPNRKRMMDVPVQHFSCIPPRKPIIKWELLNDVEHKVQCLSFGDPAPTLTVSLPGANPFVYQTSDDLSELNVTTPVLLVSSGVVECTAENALGSLKEFVHINPSKREDVRSSGKRFTCDKTLLLLTVYIAYCLCASTM